MLTGAGLSRLWPHRRAHAFFSGASWDPGRLGLRLARALSEVLLPADAPIGAVVNDTLLHRAGQEGLRGAVGARRLRAGARTSSGSAAPG